MGSDISNVCVALGERGYDIVVGSGLLAGAVRWIAPQLLSPRVIIVTDDHVGPRYAAGLQQVLIPHGIHTDLVSVPAGEASKSFDTYQELMERLLTLNPDRKTTLIALGGGVIGDLTGFAASTLLRGVPYIQVPTTLLAQVDSSVGGKTAINTASGKNLVGSFYQPRLVLADLDTLKTLDPRDMRAGYAEVIKYGLIMNPAFYGWCLANGAALVKGDRAVLKEAVMQSVAMKAQIVEADEKEGDRRAWLNFGHTFGHALEAETGYSEIINHGEAVAIGMVMACRLSRELGLIGPELEVELAAHLRKVGLPASPKDIPYAWDAQAIASHFASDKKAEEGVLTFVVLEELGKARVLKPVDPALALRVVQTFLE